MLSLDLNSKFAEYIKTSEHYFNNLKDVLSKNEYRKASEYLWGTIAQLIKALAYLYGIPLGSHKSIKIFIREIATEKNDEEYFKSFLFLEKLHVNFYDEIIEPEEFQIYLKSANNFLNKTNRLITKKLKENKK